MRSLLGLLRKEVQHIRRDPWTLVVILALPVVQVVLFGFAIRTDVDHVRLAIVDPAPDETTLALRSRFTAAGVFEVTAILQRTEDLDPLLQSGEVQEAVVFQRDFAGHVRDGDAQLLIVTDGTEPNTASLLQAYAQAVVAQYVASGFGRTAPVRLKADTTDQPSWRAATAGPKNKKYHGTTPIKPTPAR